MLLSIMPEGEDLKKGKTSIDSHEQNRTGKMDIDSFYRDYSIRSGLLHSYVDGASSLDAARNSLLFYDWFMQKFNQKKDK